ncbi:hypothetical protein L596_030231 [Steinernema carpocapsae]|uniref:Nuclear receptor domain-containing protein n=1 Tax=Steinernema carpocapsae TaxID=34508 RepID=A0A4U5LS50_STECR|nr:hypothetical protein L596_030231 [Steinernema carpocapsae]
MTAYTIENPRASLSLFKAHKVCVVCGGPARCFHYDAFTCSGCKTFFRRSLVDGKRYVCSKDENCPIDNSDRHFCKYCRLAKCLAVGMNTNAIQLEDEGARRRMHAQFSKTRTAVDYEGKTIQIVAPNLMIVENMCDKLVDKLLYFENRCDRIRFSTFDPLEEGLQHKDIQYFLSTASWFGDLNKLQRPTNWPIKLTRPPLSFEEIAYNLPYSTKHWFLLDMILSIEFAKMLGGFQIIPYEDQKEIVKSSVSTNRLFTEAFFSFENNSDSLIFPDGIKPLYLLQNVITDLQVDVFKKSSNPLSDTGCPRKNTFFAKPLSIFKQPKPNIRFSCNSKNPNISSESSEILRVARQKYTDVLLRLCQNHYGDVEGAVRFGNLIGLIQSMTNYGEKFAKPPLEFTKDLYDEK